MGKKISRVEILYDDGTREVVEPGEVQNLTHSTWEQWDNRDVKPRRRWTLHTLSWTDDVRDYRDDREIIIPI